MAKPTEKNQEENFIRIVGTDINANKTILYGIADIKGISHMFANAICNVLKLDKNAKISSLDEKAIEKLENFLTNPKKEGIPSWMLNTRKDMATGDDVHYTGKDIDFNLMQFKRRLSKLKTYRGLRHRFNLPLRGQRTKSNFRRNKTIAAMKSKQQGGKK